MTKKNDPPVSMLYEAQDEFKAALAYTERATGFSPRLIEKDYFCSLILNFLFTHNSTDDFVFKGGTALNKVHFGFYRLSEDLDFTISVAENATRGDRRKARAPFEARLSELTSFLPVFSFSKGWTGANNSTQYVAEIAYKSAIRGEVETIQIELSLREPLVMKPESRNAQSLLLDAFTNQPVIKAFPVHAMSQMEAMAEKARAALTRQKPAIRDVFDLWYAHQKGGLPTTDKKFIKLVRQKIDIIENRPTSVSLERRDEFRRQLETDLRPVLRPSDFKNFDFDNGWRIVETLADLVLS